MMHLSMFNWIDAAAGIVILIFGYVGFRTGIMASIFYICSSFACMLYIDQIHAKLGPYFYGSIIIAVALILFLGFIFGFLFQKILPGFIDKTLGSIVGLVLGLIVAVNFVLPITLSKKLPVSVNKTSKVSYTALNIAPIVNEYFAEIANYANEKFGTPIKKQVNKQKKDLKDLKNKK